MYAEIVINQSSRALNKLFDYFLPMSQMWEIGQSVIVPFGRQNILGYIVKIKQDSQLSSEQIKSIICKAKTPNLSAEMVELMFFLHENQNIRYADSLKLFLPNELRKSNGEHTKEVCVLVSMQNLVEFEKKTTKNSKNQIALCQFLKQGEVWDKLSLTKEFTSIAVKKFIDTKVLEIKDVVSRRAPKFEVMERENITPTKSQQNAIDKICAKPEVYVLFGITGSGKTEVYLKVMEKMLLQGKTAIMLVPEIGLTPQLFRQVTSRFGNKVAVLHSGLAQGERHDEWLRIQNGDAQIALGARSAIFAPLKNLGAIIIDEEHDGSYQSENSPRFSTIQIAEFRQKQNNCSLILGSATPSVETFAKVKTGEYNLISLPERVGNGELPKVQIIDMTAELASGNSNLIFSRQLLYDLENCINQKNQAIIFINRRGYSSFQRCLNCGYVAKCTDCDVTLVLHKEEDRLKCHYCGKRFKALTVCPNCKSKLIKEGAVGTEKVVKELCELFPNVKVFRMDNDSTRTKDAHQKILSEFARTKPSILVGTQMVAKGHHFPKVTLVGILDADQSLHQSNFRSGERTFQLITQVSGRAGRVSGGGKVDLQTYCPKNRVIMLSANNDFNHFFERELNLREVTKFPPFTQIIRILFVSNNEEQVQKHLQVCYNKISKLKDESTNSFAYLGAMRSPITKIQNKFRFQILMRIKQNSKLSKQIFEIAQETKEVSVFVEINPQNLN